MTTPTNPTTKRPKLLDLFCGAGGAGVGYHRAGFEVTGIDNKPQKNYPFGFMQADALEYLCDHWQEYDFIHASPPCQRYSATTPEKARDNHPDLLSKVREVLDEIGRPYIIENVPGAPMTDYIVLCGTMFGLDVIRHRWFEIRPNPILLMPPHNHYKPVVRQGYEADLSKEFMCVTGHFSGKETGMVAMGVDWMGTSYELAQSIPPAYTEFIGKQLINAYHNA